MKLTKHQRYRRAVKAKAIAMKGGKCERCGFDDLKALRFHHVHPVRRGLNRLSKNAKSSTEAHLAVLRGEGKDIKLLCANCSTIRTAKDGPTLNRNLSPAVTR